MIRPLSFILIFVSLAVLACRGDSNNESRDADSSTALNTEVVIEGETMLIGPVDRNGFALPEYMHWFDSTYHAYVPHENVVAQLEPLIGAVDIRIYLSSWCSDTQRDIPAFFRILDEMDKRPKSLQMTALDRNMSSPGGEEEGMNIEFVPTTILYRDGAEIGRIVEYPNLTMEEDLLEIMSR